jgi:hypothetical protein
MSFQFIDAVKALAVAQAAPGVDPDPDKAEAMEARTFRRRIAGLLWIPCAMANLFLAGWANSARVGVAGFVLVLVGLWLFAERGDRIAAWFRRSRPATLN